MDQQQQIQQAMHIWATMMPIILLFWAVKIALYIIPLYRIARRAGQSPAIAFLAAIPLIGRLLALYIVAFAEWRVTPLPDSPYPPAYPPTAFDTATYPPAPPAAAPVVTSAEPPHSENDPPANT